MFVNKNLWRKHFQTFIVLLAMIISLLPISILETRVKAKTDDYTPDKVLTVEMVKNMAGCEAEIKGNEIIIRPKNGASEGVISGDYKEDDFKALQNIFKKDETEDKTLRFEGNIYGYGSLKELFEESKISSLGNIGKFNVSNVTNMSFMFYYTNITSLEGLNNWNVSNVTNMSFMFYYTNITSLEGLNNWNVSNVTNMSNMFCFTNITSLEALKDWNISNVTNMNGMFYHCENLTSLEALKNWNVSNVTNMNTMFSSCNKITSLEALKDWNVSNVTNMNTMFSSCNKITSLEALNNWNVSNVKSMENMFHDCRNITSLDALKNWNVSNVTNLNGMFHDCYNITSLEGLKNWDVSKVTTMRQMFSYCNNITSLDALKNWNVSNVTDIDDMFYSCKNITSLEGLKNWDVSKVKTMRQMFSYCNNITSLEPLKNWNVSNVTDMYGMFSDCKNITSLEALKNWNVSKVESMNYMFHGCTNLTYLEALKNWDVSNVTGMASMFLKCHNLGKYNEIVDALNAWNINKFNAMTYMFSGIGDGLSLDKHKLILDFSNASIKKVDVSTFSNMYGILILNNKNLSYGNDVLKDTFLTVTNNENYLNGYKDLKYYRYITLKYGDNKVKKISMPAVYDSKGSKDVYNIIKAEVDKKIKATINELNAEDPSLLLTGEYTNLSTLQEKTLALFGEYELNSLKKESKIKVLKAKIKYEADDNLPFNEKKVIKAAEDGQKKITITKTLKDGNWVQEGKTKEEIIKPVQDGLIKVGNKEVSTNGDETITKIYEVNPDTGALTNPKVVKKVIVRLETISAKMKYEADENLEYNTKQKVSDPENGQKRITIISTLTNDQLVEGKPTEEIVKPAKDGLTKVGNKEVSTNGDETITKIYEVNPDTGALTNPKVVKKVVVRLETISAKMKYEADENLEYNTKQKVSDPEDGQKRITIISTLTNDQLVEGKPTEEIVKPAKDGLTKVGNKEVSKNGDETITKIYEVNPDTGALTNPKVVKKVVVRLETITAKMKYVADETLEYNTKQKVSDPENGQKRITIISTLTNDQLVEGKPTEEIIKKAKDGLTKVGNKKVVKNGDTTTIEIHEVDPNTGDLGKVISKEEIKLVTVKAKTKYEANDNLTFNEKKVIKVAEDGQNEVTTKKTLKDGNWVQEGEPKEKVIKPAKDGLTKVGNKEVSTNGDETITKIYEVNPDTGELSNPKVTKTVKMVRLVPAQHHNHNNQQTMSHIVDTSDHSSLSYYGMFLSALSVLCLILLKKEKLN